MSTRERRHSRTIVTTLGIALLARQVSSHVGV